MSTKIQDTSCEHLFKPVDDKNCTLFMETRQWAIDQNIENPIHTAIMRVAIEYLLTAGVPSVVVFRESLASFTFLAKEVELIGGGITQISQQKGKKLAEIRQQLIPFSIFDDAYEGTLEA